MELWPIALDGQVMFAELLAKRFQVLPDRQRRGGAFARRRGGLLGGAGADIPAANTPG